MALSPRMFVATVMFTVSCTAGPIDIVDDMPLLNGLEAHWALDEIGGTLVPDSSGKNKFGTLSGGSWLAAGQFGGALHFEPGTEVSVQSFTQATSAWTVALWVRTPAIAAASEEYRTLLSTEHVFIGGWEMNLHVVNNVPRYQFGYYLGPGKSDYFTAECECVKPDEWKHLAAVVDGNLKTLSLYVDGVYRLDAASTSPPNAVRAPIKNGNFTLYMGRWETPASRQFMGDLDDIAIFSRALSGDEIAHLFQKPAPNVP